jgi:protein TonB
MNFAQQQVDPRRQLAGIATIVLLHAIAIYALINGLAHKVVDVLKKPLEVSIVEDIKTTPSPPPKVLHPVRQTVEPPPAYVPPPEVQVQAEPVQPMITVTATTPPLPEVIAPPAPAPAPAPEPVAVVPAPVSNVSVACPNYRDVLSRAQSPAQAQRMGLSGDVTVEFMVGPSGSISDVVIAKSSNRIFDAVAIAAVAKFHCIGQGQNVRVRLPIGFAQDG